MSKKLLSKIISILITLVLPLSIFSCFFVQNKPCGWWHTISDTYYISPVFSIIMILASVFVFLYGGKNIPEKLLNFGTVVSILGIVIFPCSNLYGLEKVGIFNLPDGKSSILHTVFSILMLSFSFFEIHFIMLKEALKKYKKIYYGILIALIMGMIFFLLGKTTVLPKFVKFIGELIMLSAMGFAWWIKDTRS